MLCSKCSGPVKPVVAIDIDGTLGDYHGHLLAFTQQYLGSEPPAFTYDGSSNFGDWVCDQFEIDRRTYRDIKLAYRQGAQKRSMPVFPYASVQVQKIRAAGAELWLTTSRPYMRLDNIDPDTRAWLTRNQIEFDYLLYDEDKYQVLRRQVSSERVVAVLDDLPEMCHQAEQAFGVHVPILRRTVWNRGVTEFFWSTNSLQAAAEEIINRIEGWKEIAA